MLAVELGAIEARCADRLSAAEWRALAEARRLVAAHRPVPPRVSKRDDG